MLKLVFKLVGVVSELTAKHTLILYINTKHMQNIYVMLNPSLVARQTCTLYVEAVLQCHW